MSTILLAALIIVGLIMYMFLNVDDTAAIQRCPSCGLTALEREYQPAHGSTMHYRCGKCGASYRRYGDGPLVRG